MRTVTFTYAVTPWYTGYRCDRPGNMDGEYVRADVARGLLVACDHALNALVGCVVPAGGCDDAAHVREAVAKLKAAIRAATGDTGKDTQRTVQ